MDQPEPTSPEVADACRRAGLPIIPDPDGRAEAATAGVALASSYQGEEVGRAIADLRGVLTTMGQLYGPALPAPGVAALERLTSAWDGYRWEVEDGTRLRHMLEHEVAFRRAEAIELVGERDRARATAVALEQELAAPSVFGIPIRVDPALPPDVFELRHADGRLAGSFSAAVPGDGRSVLAVPGASSAGDVAPTGCPSCDAPVGGVHGPACTAIPAGVGG